MPDFWRENQGAPPYDELSARRVANILKLRAAGITSITSPAILSNSTALVAAFLAAAATTERIGDFNEGKRRTGN